MSDLFPDEPVRLLFAISAIQVEGCLRECHAKSIMMGSPIGACFEHERSNEYEALVECADPVIQGESCSTQLMDCGIELELSTDKRKETHIKTQAKTVSKPMVSTQVLHHLRMDSASNCRISSVTSEVFSVPPSSGVTRLCSKQCRTG